MPCCLHYLKKQSLDFEVYPNFRPISKLKFLSKVLEKVAAVRLCDYLDQNNLNEGFYSAYKAQHNCETALLRVQSDILEAIDNRQCVVLLLLDLSAAFDTVDHATLLHKLKLRFGINGKTLQGFHSYLTGRSQFLQVNGDSSTVNPLQQGVPQESVLGTILYLLYTSPSGDLIRKHNMSFHLYADDTQIYKAFGCDDDAELCQVTNRIENCLMDITNWMTVNKLKYNSDKAELLLFRSKFRPSLMLPSITAGTDTIYPTEKARNIGVICI